MIADVQEKLKAEIESHQRTKIEFEKYRMDHAFHEYENGNKALQTFINKLQTENAALKIQIIELKKAVRELNAQLLPSNNISVSGVQRRYEFRRAR